MSAQKLMLVLGATGFLGKFVIDKMIASDYPLRVVTRGGADWQNSTVSSLRHKGVDVIMGDITKQEILERAVEGTSAIVNMAGCFLEARNSSYEEVNVDAVEQLAQVGKAAGVQRVIHVSCLGARRDADCRYFKTKWDGEEIVRDSKQYWTIFRPSFIFGNRFPFLEHLKPVFTFKMFLPVIGSGTNTIQPVFVEDVADCIVQSIYSRECVGKSFDLVGPDDFSMLELLEMSRNALEIGGPTMNLPSQISGKTMGIMAKALPRSILTNDLAGMMSDDSCSTQDDMLGNFQVANASMHDYFPAIVESLGVKSKPFF
ncbi:MAG: NmrA family NAD(P)-binding protein [Candidatus Melainabacteria bacterium]|nr:NmrA family NAD(P)-binding protein [Candidatus Melainabacteria bacterium]